MGEERYIVIYHDTSSHDAPYSVVDLKRPRMLWFLVRTEKPTDGLPPVCNCDISYDAEMIAKALNAMESKDD